MALTREPSLKRASTMGVDSSTRRPTCENDLVDDSQQVGRRRGRWTVVSFKQALALNVYLLVRVHQDVAYGGVLEQRFRGVQGRNTSSRTSSQICCFFERTQQRGLGIDQAEQSLADLAANALVVDGGQRFEVDLVEQFSGAA